MAGVALNPPLESLGRIHAVVGGTAREYGTRPWAGPLSLKWVVRGAGEWSTANRRYLVDPGSILILNRGEEYSVTIDALQPVETFCVFFEDGFVEDARRALSSGSSQLLDRAETSEALFIERMHSSVSVRPILEELRRARTEETLYVLATELIGVTDDLRARVSRLPALRAATRDELHRRLARGTDYIHANLAGSIRLADIAREACLSPFHFHRLFSSLRGETPHAFVTRLRLERAQRLLRDGDEVGEVAAACGFESVPSFTALFRRRFGVPPGRFRKIEEALPPHAD